MTFLAFLLKVATPVVVAYKLRVGTRFTARGIAAYGFMAAGVLALFAGYDLAAVEEARFRYGHVYPGHVIEKLSSTGAEGTRHIGTHGGRNQAQTRPVVTISGFHLYDQLARLIVTGTPLAWVVDYQFACDAPRPCFGRDFVSEEQWARLPAGGAVNVRQAEGETSTSRLDDNPQWPFALADMGVGAVLLVVAAVLAERIVLFRRRQWLVVPAVVTAVEPVTYKDATRLRVRFAYFDPKGDPQESADEVAAGSWKPGDDCQAVLRADAPELATLQPLPAADGRGQFPTTQLPTPQGESNGGGGLLGLTSGSTPQLRNSQLHNVD